MLKNFIYTLIITLIISFQSFAQQADNKSTLVSGGKNQETIKGEIKKLKSKPAWSIKYDKFDDVTNVYLGGWNIISGLGGRRCDMFLSFTFSGEILKESPKEFFITFALFPNRLSDIKDEYKNISEDLKLISGQDRFTFNSSGKDSILAELLSGGFSPPLTCKFKISRNDYDKISKTNSLSLKLGTFEKELNQKQIGLFQEVLQLSNVSN